MATVQRASMIQYPDGQVVIHNIRKKRVSVPVFGANESYSATLVNTWYDGSTMDDSKADGSIYFKLKALPSGADSSLAQYVGSYFRLNLPNWGETFLEKPNVASLRNMTSTEILLLQMGYYKGVTLLGYYAENGGDTPAPIEYYLSTTSEGDDGGSVIEVGGIKLEHEFVGAINSKYFGLGDNIAPENQTEVIQRIVDLSAILAIPADFPEGFYYINGRYNPNSVGVSIKSNTHIRTDIGTFFKVLPQEEGSYSAFSIRRANNVTIERLNVIGERDEHTGTTGEFGMGLDIRQCDNISVFNITASDFWGDGIYLGKGNLGATNNNILIDGADIKRCRRQGISIVTGNGLFIKNILIQDIEGVSPQYGVDIEPNDVEDVLINVNLHNIKTHNCAGGGILVNLMQLHGAEDSVSINIDNHYSLEDTRGFQVSGVSLEGVIKGNINYNKAYIKLSRFAGISLRNYTENAPLLNINDPTIIDSGTSHDTDTDPKYATGIQVYRESTDSNTYKIGNVSIVNPTIIDTRQVPLIKKGLYVNDLTSASSINIKSVKLVNPRIINIPNITWRAEEGIEDPLGNLKGLTTGLNVVTNGASFSSIYSNLGATGTTTSTLSRYKNSPSFTFLVESPFNLRVTMTSGSLGNYLAPNEYLQSNEVGAKIVLKCVDEELNIWLVDKMVGVWTNTTLGKSWENGSLIIQDANPSVKGLVNQAEASADTAIESAGATPTKEEFDALLAELRDLKTKARTAGILAT